jgi:beta-lactam-binding protein with PASTA domain
LEICKKNCTFADELLFFSYFLRGMALKNKQKKFNWKAAIINIVVMIVLIATLIVGLVIYLRSYTQHGNEVIVPNITNMHIAEAEIMLGAESLHVQVIDSTYSTKTPLGTIVEQNPSPGSHVKRGRTIYVIQNARMRRPVILPELRDLSLRQAEATAKTLGLIIGETIYQPSTFKNIILDVRVCDTSVVAGTRLEEGVAITLVIGKGKGTQQVTVPHIVGKSIEDAKSWLFTNSLILGTVEYDTLPGENTDTQFLIYQQMPASGTIVVEGTSVNIKLSTDIEKTITTNYEESNEEDFF